MDTVNLISELRKQRGRLFAKRSLYNKQGKDISDINAELDNIRMKIANIATSEDKGKGSKTKAVKNVIAKDSLSSNMTQIQNSPIDIIKQAIKKYGWRSGMNFGRYGCVSMVLENLRIKDQPSKEEVVVSFTLRYKTNRHEAENKVTWHIPYTKAHLFKNDLHNVQYGVKIQKAFTDKKFFEDKFNKADLEKKGWKIIK